MAGLTDRQINEVYAHERDRDGEVVVPEPAAPPADDKPVTVEAQIARLEMLAGMGVITEANAAELKAALLAKHGLAPTPPPAPAPEVPKRPPVERRPRPKPPKPPRREVQ